MSPARRTSAEARELRASLLVHAQRLVARGGAAALTMRALAAEAGCAVGLPYKVFDNREDLVSTMIHAEFARMGQAFEEFVARAGTGTVGDNLGRYAELLLNSPAVALFGEISHDDTVTAAITARAGEAGLVAALETTVTNYLAAEKRLGRVAASVDEAAFGFLIAGAIHNLLISGEPYPRPDMGRLRQLLTAVARQLAPTPPRR